MMKKKLLAMALIIALAAIAVVGGTLAYFTDNDTETNTFTVGKVNIKLDEPDWNADEALIMPGVTLAKDPTIKVLKRSQNAYVFLEMTLPENLMTLMLNHYNATKETDAPSIDFDDLKLDSPNTDKNRAAIMAGWFNGVTYTDWKMMNAPEADELSMVLGYRNGALAAGESVKFMESFTMPATVTSEMIKNAGFETNKFDIVFTAHAIQATEIADLDAAYDALFN